MEKLLDYTIQRQMTEMKAQTDQVLAQNAQMAAQLAALTALIQGQPAGGAITKVGPQQHISHTSHIGAQQNIETQQNIGTQNVQIAQTIVNIHPWDGEDRISVPVALIAAAFSENPRLAEYCRLDDTAKTDPKIAAPYVTEALVDLTRRVHADPLTRNIYLNPRRADQALVCLKSGRWEARPLIDATQLLFDGVAHSIHHVITTNTERSQLPLEVQASACYVPMLYENEPEEYVKRAKAPMAAHLSNMTPLLP